MVCFLDYKFVRAEVKKTKPQTGANQKEVKSFPDKDRRLVKKACKERLLKMQNQAKFKSAIKDFKIIFPEMFRHLTHNKFGGD